MQHQGNTSQNHRKIPVPSQQDACSQKGVVAGVGEDVERPSYTAVRDVKWRSHLGKRAVSQRFKHRVTECLVIPLVGMYPRDLKMCVCTETY